MKIETGQLSIVQLTRNEFINIPRKAFKFKWNKEYLTDSSFINGVFGDYNEFWYEGSIMNGYLEGFGKLYYLDSDY